MIRLLVIILLALVSLSWLYFLSIKVPSYLLISTDFHQEGLTKFPSSIEELKSITTALKSIIDDEIGFSYVMVLFISAYTFKQTFAIPGSVFLNLLAGALFGLQIGFPLTCFLTACGATCCYLLARFAGRQAATK